MTCDEIGPEARALFADLHVSAVFTRIARFQGDEGVVAMALDHGFGATYAETRDTYERLLSGFVDRYGDPANVTASGDSSISFWVSGPRTTTVVFDAHDGDEPHAQVEVYWH